MGKNYEKIDVLLAKIENSGIFRNDGKGHLYVYQKKYGIWIRQKPLDARNNIFLTLKSENVMLHREELVCLQRELEEYPLLTEKKLASNNPTSLVAVRNGVVDLATGKLQDFNPDLYLRYALDFTFNEDIKTIPDTNAWIRFAATSLGINTTSMDTDPLWHLFMEAFFFPMTNLGNAKKMIIFLGPPNCGKSMLLKIMGRVIGEDAYVSLSFEDMLQRFRGSLMDGHRVAISHEMPLRPLRKLDVIKKIISGDPIIIEEKCQNARKYTPHINLVFAANNLPSLAEPDAGGAFADRLLIVPFKAVTHRDAELLEKMWEDRDAFLTLAARSMASFIKRGLVFSECPKGRNILEEFRQESFSLATFIREKFVRTNGACIPFRDFIDEYNTFCDEIVVPAIPKTEVKAALIQMGFTFKRSRASVYPNAVSCLIGLSKKTEPGA